MPDMFDFIDDFQLDLTVQHMLSVYNGTDDKLIDQYAGLEESQCNDDGIISYFNFMNKG